MTDFAKMFFENPKLAIATMHNSQLAHHGDYTTFEDWLAAECEAFSSFIETNFGHLPEDVWMAIAAVLTGDCYESGAYYGLSRAQTDEALAKYHNN